MQAYQLHDYDEDVVGTVLVCNTISDHVHEDWCSFLKKNPEFPNVCAFAEQHGYVVLNVDFVQPNAY